MTLHPLHTRCLHLLFYAIVFAICSKYELVQAALASNEGCSLWLADSTLPGTGRGVFAGRRIENNTVISVSRRLEVTQSKAEVTQLDDYVVEASSEGREVVFDTPVFDLNTGITSMMNHGEGRFANVKLFVVAESGAAELRSLRAIKKGEELFVQYGNRDWFALRGIEFVQAPNNPQIVPLEDLEQAGVCLPSLAPEPSGDGVVTLRALQPGDVLGSPMLIFQRSLFANAPVASVSLGHKDADVGVLPLLLPGRLGNGLGKANLAYSFTAVDFSVVERNAQALCDNGDVQLELKLKVLRPIDVGATLTVDYDETASAFNKLGYIPTQDGFMPLAWAESVHAARIRSANAGDSQAQFQIAQYLYYGLSGDGSSQKANPVAAIEWYSLAAAKGHVAAQVHLGNSYKDGDGVDADAGASAEWYKKAAEQGDGEAQLALSKAYQKGLGVEADLTQAARWMETAAATGVTAAMYYTALAYKSGNGVKQDSRSAVNWLRRASDQGHTRAIYSLAVAYGKGDGCAQSLPVAMRWFRQAAEAGHAESQYNLAVALETGSFVKKNITEAEIWYQKAAAQGLTKRSSVDNEDPAAGSNAAQSGAGVFGHEAGVGSMMFDAGSAKDEL